MLVLFLYSRGSFSLEHTPPNDVFPAQTFNYTPPVQSTSDVLGTSGPLSTLVTS